MYICDFSRSVGAGSATTLKTRGLTRSVSRLMTPRLARVPDRSRFDLREIGPRLCQRLATEALERALRCLDTLLLGRDGFLLDPGLDGAVALLDHLGRDLSDGPVEPRGEIVLDR